MSDAKTSSSVPVAKKPLSGPGEGLLLDKLAVLLGGPWHNRMDWRADLPAELVLPPGRELVWAGLVVPPHESEYWKANNCSNKYIGIYFWRPPPETRDALGLSGSIFGDPICNCRSCVSTREAARRRGRAPQEYAHVPIPAIPSPPQPEGVTVIHDETIIESESGAAALIDLIGAQSPSEIQDAQRSVEQFFRHYPEQMERYQRFAVDACRTSRITPMERRSAPRRPVFPRWLPDSAAEWFIVADINAAPLVGRLIRFRSWPRPKRWFFTMEFQTRVGPREARVFWERWPHNQRGRFDMRSIRPASGQMDQGDTHFVDYSGVPLPSAEVAPDAP